MRRINDTQLLSRIFGYRNRKEFIQDAVEEKIRRLKGLLFSRSAEKVRRGIVKRGLTEDEILEDFERFRHS